MKNIVKINDNEYRDMVKAGALEIMARNTHIASYPCEDMKSVNRYRTICFFERSVVDGKYVKGALLGSCVEQELNVSGIFTKPAEARAIKSTGAYNADVDDNRYFACTKDGVIYFVGNRGDITNVKVEG